MANKKTSYVGKTLFVESGVRYNRFGQEKKMIGREVTIRSEEPARNGKTRVFWKSQGYKANVLIK